MHSSRDNIRWEKSFFSGSKKPFKRKKNRVQMLKVHFTSPLQAGSQLTWLQHTGEESTCHPSLCRHHTILMTAALWWVLSLFFKILLAALGPLHFHTNFRDQVVNFWKRASWDFDRAQSWIHQSIWGVLPSQRQLRFDFFYTELCLLIKFFNLHI